MILYVLKSVICALFFIAMYHCMMEQDKMLRFKRFYLLVALVFSLLIPFVGVSLFPDVFSPVEDMTNIYISTADEKIAPVFLSALVDEGTSDSVQKTVGEVTFTWTNLVVGLYLFVTLVLLIRFIYHLMSLIKMGKCRNSFRQGNTKIIIQDRLNVSFSFFHYVFISKNDYQNKNVKNEILIHELTHVKQMHSADVLFVEVLIILFWFNPALYLYRRAMKLNHEFLADEGVINSTGNIPVYQMILIDRAATSCHFSFTSQLTYLITKKRLIMMTKTTSRRSFLLKLIVIVPAFLLAGGVFSAKVMAGSKLEAPIDGTLAVRISSTTEDSILRPGSGVSLEMMDVYSNIVSKYLDKAEAGKVTWKSMTITDEDELILYPLYIQMNDAQRKQQLVRFLSPFTPMKLRSPNKDEWNGCTNKSEIWLDGKKISHEIALTHDRKSIVFFMKSKKSGKSYLWTQKGYDEYMNRCGTQVLRSNVLKMPIVYGVTTGFRDKNKTVKNGRVE